MQDGTESAGLIRQIDEAADSIGFFMDQLVGRKVQYEDGKQLIDALFFAKVEIEAAITKLDLVLNDEAVVL